MRDALTSAREPEGPLRLRLQARNGLASEGLICRTSASPRLKPVRSVFHPQRSGDEISIFFDYQSFPQRPPSGE